MALLTGRRLVGVLSLFIFFALATMAVSPFFGAESINVAGAVAAWARDPRGAGAAELAIILDLRMARIVLAFLTGAALGVVGAVFQALLRNPLATPYTLGVASGGSFGAVVALFLPSIVPWIEFHVGPVTHVQVFAFAGASLAVVLIYYLARKGGRISTMELLLAGVTLGMVFSSLIMAVRYFTTPERLVEMDRWMMGRLDIDGYRWLPSVLPFLVPGVGVLLLMARQFDQIAFGEEMAMGRGVNVGRLQKVAFLCGSLATASVVAVAGPIGFIGLIVPHTVRRIVGPDHRLLLPCTFFAAGGFLVICDTLARTVIAPTELPVGIITSLLGGPFFIYLLVRGERIGEL